MAFHATKAKVFNRGIPPDSFLQELVQWGKTAGDDIFVQNAQHDIYSNIVGVLGPWQDLMHRRCAMLEVMRVLAGFESSWDWNAGKDPNNHNPDPVSWETGAFQVSADSLNFGQELKDLVLAKVGSLDIDAFRDAMKQDHQLAMDYIARLLRRTVNQNGPVRHHDIDQWLKQDAVSEFRVLLAS